MILMTNKKLLKKIIEQSQIDNEIVIEQLKTHILESSEVGIGMMNELFGRYAANYSSLTELLEQSANQISGQLEQQQETANDIRVDIEKLYETLDETKNGLIQKMDSQFSQMSYVNKTLSNQMESLQRDNAIIMETLQLILTNMLLDEVPKP